MSKKNKINEEEFLAQREKEVRKKHRRVVPGSIKREDAGLHAGKLTVEMKCQGDNCGTTRRVATSDLHQVRLCLDCTEEARRRKRRKKTTKKPKPEPLSFAEANNLAHNTQKGDEEEENSLPALPAPADKIVINETIRETIKETVPG